MTMEEFKAALERVRSGSSEAEEVVLPSGRVRLTRDSRMPTGIRIEPLDGDGVHPPSGDADPERRKAFDRLKDVAERFRSGASTSEEVTLPSGETVRMEADPEVPGSFTMGSRDGGPVLRSISFEPSPDRPQRYPTDLPFLADERVSLMEMAGGGPRTLQWMGSKDPDRLLEELRSQLRGVGWQEGKETRASMPFGAAISVTFTKGERERTILLTHRGGFALLMLMERRGPGE